MIKDYLGKTIKDINFDGGLNPYIGKVRHCYDTPEGNKMLVTSDRLSAFDRQITTIPFKGQVLTQLSRFWFEQTKDICPNHVIDYPDPNIVVCKDLNMLPVELVVRGYLAGSTGTSVLTMYKRGEREMYGVKFPDGMRDNEKLPTPIITPTTKAASGDHDAPLSAQQIVEEGILPTDVWEQVSAYALALFARGQEIAAKAGLILVDTKYEFGFDKDGVLMVGDEIHTPDSSRYWMIDGYEASIEKGEAPQTLDKDQIRRIHNNIVCIFNLKGDIVSFQADSGQMNILITGGGLIGGTLALDYSRSLKDTDITVYEADEQSAHNLRLELKNKGVENVQVVSDELELIHAATHADVVDHCVPINALQDVQQKIGSSLKRGAVVTNRGSAQSYSSASIAPHINNERGIYHFGIHPVVGRERKPGQTLQIHEGTFENQTAIMEPPSANASEEEMVAYNKLKFINEAIGFNVKILPTHIHDRLLGALSHENTLGLQTLVNTREGGVNSGLGATMMRAASGTTAMWSPIHEFNSVAVSDSHDIQMKHLQELHRLLENDDVDGLYAFVSEANEFRSQWNDGDQNIESLSGAIEELGTKGDGITPAKLASQVSVPFAVSIARTHGIKETVTGLETDLMRFGHTYVDLLNSSAKDSTLAARYNPEEVAQLLISNKGQVLEGISKFITTQERIVGDIKLYADGVPQSGLKLKKHIEEATLTMASESTPAPRRTGGGDGFENFKSPNKAYDPADSSSSKTITAVRKPTDLGLS